VIHYPKLKNPKKLKNSKTFSIYKHTFREAMYTEFFNLTGGGKTTFLQNTLPLLHLDSFSLFSFFVEGTVQERNYQENKIMAQSKILDASTLQSAKKGSDPWKRISVFLDVHGTNKERHVRATQARRRAVGIHGTPVAQRVQITTDRPPTILSV
jgi:hypothetical protein